MSKNLAPLLGIACLLWLAVWTWQLTDSYREETAMKASFPGFSVSGEGFQFDAASSFAFPFSSADPELPEDSDTLLQAVADYLNQHAEQQLTLTGNYAKTERNKTPYPNLGLARAEAIKKALLKKGVADESILTMGIQVDNALVAGDKILGGVFFTFFEKETDRQAIQAESTGQPVEQKTISGETETSQNIYFHAGKYDLTEAEGDAGTILDEIRSQLLQQPGQRLLITAFASTEEEKVPNSDLAEMRAINVRRFFVDNGVRRSQIEMKFLTISVPGRSGRRVELEIGN